VQAHRHRPDVVGEPRERDGPLDLLQGVVTGTPDAVEDRAGEGLGVLQDDPALAPDGGQVECGEVLAVVQDAAVGGPVEADEQAQQGRLAAAIGGISRRSCAKSGPVRDFRPAPEQSNWGCSRPR
jgi:hypothetical protein